MHTENVSLLYPVWNTLSILYNHSTPQMCVIRPMAQVSMLDTFKNPTQSNCQQYIRDS